MIISLSYILARVGFRFDASYDQCKYAAAKPGECQVLQSIRFLCSHATGLDENPKIPQLKQGNIPECTPRDIPQFSNLTSITISLR